jgi:hypothetical protein
MKEEFLLPNRRLFKGITLKIRMQINGITLRNEYQFKDLSLNL